ncbi:MAG: septal ring lytic transglycosylase RlpA family protein [Leptolyngbyaceae cyanobacterium]
MEILGLVWAASMLNPSGAFTNNDSPIVIDSPALADVSRWFVPLAQVYGWASSAETFTTRFNQYSDTTSWLIPNTTELVSHSSEGHTFPDDLLNATFGSAFSKLNDLPETQANWEDEALGAVRLVRADAVPASTDAPDLLADNHCVARTVPYQAEPIVMQTSARWQVWVHNQYIGTVSGTEAAEQIASKLRSQLQITASDPDKLRPLFGQNFAAVSLNDDAVFVVDETMHLHPELPVAAVAVQWVNNLRIALDAEPLGLAAVQMAMEGLQETPQEFYGTASWYGPGFHGRQTANGERFDQNALTAAHKTLPFGTQLKVRNRLNGKTVVVRINDRGPYIGQRSLDLSKAAAQCLGSENSGVIPYEAVILEPIPSQKVEGLITAIRQENIN